MKPQHIRKIILVISCLFLAGAAYIWSAENIPSTMIKSSSDIDWHASGSLPPGAEYHLIYEEPKTHAVQLIVRMPKGYQLPPHIHSYDETIFMLKGKIVLKINSKTETLVAGSYAVLPAKTSFALEVVGFGEAQFIAAFNGPFDAKPENPKP